MLLLARYARSAANTLKSRSVASGCKHSTTECVRCVLLGRVGNLEAGERVNESARGTLVHLFFSPIQIPHPLGASAEERALHHRSRISYTSTKVLVIWNKEFFYDFYYILIVIHYTLKILILQFRE